MAKKTHKDDLDMDLDFDMDKEFGDMGFGSPPPPPKNAREAVARGSKDLAKGFMAGFKDDKLKTAGRLAKASMPSSLTTEYNEIADALGNAKNTILNQTADLKKTTAQTIQAINKLVPENSKMNKLLGKLIGKLEDPKEPKGPSKEEIETNKIQQGILASLGEMQSKQHADAMVAQAIASKQHASTAALLQNVYAETKLQRNFHYEITNKYYRKSLELQYKHLFTAREQLELMRVGFETFKNQLEAIRMATALPDIIKTRNSEFIIADFKGRLRNNTLDHMFKEISPLKNMGDKFNKKLSSGINNFLAGMGMVGDAAGGLADMQAMNREMGISGAYSLGNMLAGFGQDLIGGRVRKLLEGNKKVQRGVYNLKDAAANPRDFLKNIMKNSNRKTGLGKLKYFGANALYGLTGTNAENSITFGRANLNEAHVFDGRAHTSLVKVIPGLLSKIHAELKASRTGGDPHDHELLFDNHSDTFKTKKALIKDFQSDMKRSMKKGFSGHVGVIIGILKDAGISVSGSDANALGQALLSYTLKPGTSLSTSTLYNPEFLKTIASPKLASSMGKGATKLIKYLSANPYEIDTMNNALAALRTSLPLNSQRLQDIYKGGGSDVISKMGLGTINAEGHMMYNSQGMKNMIMGSYGGQGMSDYAIPASMIGASSSIAGRKYANAANAKIDKSIQSLKTMMPDSVTEVVVNGKKKLDKVVESSLGRKVTGAFKKRLTSIETKLKSAYKKLRTAEGQTADKARIQQLRQDYEELKQEVGPYLQTAIRYGDDQIKYIQAEGGIKEFSKKIAKKGVDNANHAIKLVKSKEFREDAIAKARANVTKASNYVTSGNALSDVQKLQQTLKNTDKKTIVSFFRTKKAKVEHFMTTGKTGKVSSAAKAGFNRVKRAFNKAYDDLVPEKQKNAISGGIDVLNAKRAELTGVVGEYLESVQNSPGYNKLSEAVAIENIKRVTNEAKRSMSSNIDGGLDSAVTAIHQLQSAEGRSELRSGLSDKIENGLEGVRNPTRMMAKLGGAAMDFIKARPLEEVKEEYFNSEEYKSGNAPSFLGWVEKMGYKIKGDKPLIQRVLSKTREWDRKMFGALVKSPFKAIGMVFGKKGRSAMGGTVKAGAKMTSFALDMLPFGLGKVMQAPFQLMAETVALVRRERGENDKKEKENNRAGSWRNRLKLFGRRDKTLSTKDREKANSSYVDKLKKGGIIALLAGAVAGLGSLGIGMDTLIDVAKGIGSLVSGIAGAAGWVWDKSKGAGQWMANTWNSLTGKQPKIDPITGQPMYDKDGNPIYEDGVSAENAGNVAGVVGVGGAGLAAYYGTKTAVKAGFNATKNAITGGNKPPQAPEVKRTNIMDKINSKDDYKPSGRSLYRRLIEKVRNVSSKVAWMLDQVKDKIIRVLDVLSNAWERAKKFFKNITRILTNEKVIKKVGAGVIKKAAAKVGAMVAAAASGIGAFLTLGMAIYEIAWIIYYMWSDDMTLKQAFLYQMFDIHPKDKEINAIIDGDEAKYEREEEARVKAEAEQAMKAEGVKAPPTAGTAEAVKVSNTLSNVSSGSSSSSSSGGGGGGSTGGSSGGGSSGVKPNKHVKGTGYLAKKPLTAADNKFPQYSPSPYIIPQKQNSSDPQKRPAFVNLLNNDTKQALVGFAEHYYDVTGKPLKVNSAKRTLEQQIFLWEQEAKTKYTGPRSTKDGTMKDWQAAKARDRAAALKAGGKINGKDGNGGAVAYPNPWATTGHLGGNAIDLNVREAIASPDTKNKHWFWDGIAAQYGLTRPLMGFRNPVYNIRAGQKGGRGEDWHFHKTGNQAEINAGMMDDGEPDMLSAAEMNPSATKATLNAQAEEAKRQQSSQGSSAAAASAGAMASMGSAGGGSSGGSSSSGGSYGAAGAAAAGGSTGTYSSDTTTSSSSGGTFNFNTSKIEETLTRQLQVQIRSMEYLEAIKNILSNGGDVPPTEQTTPMPNPVIDLTRKEVFTI